MTKLKVSLAEVLQAAIYIILMVLAVCTPCSAQEVEHGEIYLESDGGVIFIRDAGPGNEFVRSLTLQPDQDYEMLLYIHNAASAELGPDGYVEGVHFTLSAPDAIAGGLNAEISALLTANNTDPAITGSTVELTAAKALSITFEDEDGKLYPVRRCDGDLNFQGFVDVLKLSVDDQTTLSGIIGDLPSGNGAEAFAVVFFQFRTEAVSTRSPALPLIVMVAIVVVFAFFIWPWLRRLSNKKA